MTAVATDSNRFRSVPAVVLTVYLVGLLLYRYPLLTVAIDGTMILRPDWLLSLPLLLYVFCDRIRITRASLYFGLFALIVMSSGVYTGALIRLEFWTILLQLVFVLALFTALLSLGLESDQMRGVFRFWLVLVTLAALFGLYQSIGFNSSLPSLAEFTASTTQSYNGYNRPNGFYTEPAMFADVLISGIAILLPTVTTSEPVYFRKRTEFILLGLFSLVLLLAGSLGGYLVALISVFAFVVVPDLRRPVLYVFSVCVLAGISGLVVSAFLSIDFVEMVLNRFRALFLLFLGQAPVGGGSVDIRLARALAAVRAWIQNPLFGTGPGLYDDWILASDPLRVFDISLPLTKTHGAWVQVPAVTGTFGMLAFGAGWLQVLRDAGGAMSRLTGAERVLVLSSVCLVITQLVAWSLDLTFVSGLRWGLTGLAYAAIISVGGDQ